MPLHPRPITSFKVPPKNDPTELIKDRFICEGGSLLICAYTHQGKSSLMAQLVIHFALKRATLGFTPARPLSALIIQAENDDGDISEQVDGTLDTLCIPRDQFDREAAGVEVCHTAGETGQNLMNDIVKVMDARRYDSIWLDPGLAFIAGDNNKGADVKTFLRHQFDPLLKRYKAFGGIACHMNKPTKEPGGKRRDFDFLDLLYAATGSQEWANWARAVLVLMPEDGKWRLSAPKRGNRLGWSDYAGNLATSKLLRRDEERMFWHESDEWEGAPLPPEAVKLGELLPLDGDGMHSSDWMRSSALPKTSFHRARRLCLKHGLAREQDGRYWRSNGVH